MAEPAGSDGIRDREARERIRAELDRNLLVEAAAGAGKTHALVGRMVSLVATGRCEIERMAAVTFTRKAAGEMRGRLLARLEEAYRERLGDDDPEIERERERLARSLERFERSFVGTIHSFCARLLRERPVEAGVDPAFAEMDEREESRLRREAWDAYVEREEGRGTRRLERIEAVGLAPEELYATFERLCRYPEVELPREEVPRPEMTPAVEAAGRFVDRALGRLPEEAPERGWGPLQRTLFAADSFRRNRDVDDPIEGARFLELFESGAAPVRLNRWPDPDVGRDVREELEELLASRVEETLRRWREHRYPRVLEFVRPAVRFYRRRRLEAGRLDFQDLLLLAARLLRRHPEVREHFSRRFAHLLVDEFQDTDPLQAEVLFLLTGEDREEDDWRRLVPRPGSLFLVGDPKQSIYRFRRADIDVYRLVRERVLESGGDVVELSTSFRSLDPLVEWLNRSLERAFEEHDGDVQPDFAALTPYRRSDADVPCVRRLVHEKVPRNPPREVAVADAARIAAWIRAAVDGRVTLPAEEEGRGRPAPGDFLVLLRQKRHLRIYARALEDRGVPYEISGGGAVSESEELAALLDMVRAALHPDDPVALLAYLRGPLAGVSDAELHRYRRARRGRGSDGSPWRYRAEVPEFEGAGGVRDAFERLRWADERVLRGLPPAAAFERLLDRTGLLAQAAGEEAGSSRAGSLLKALSLVRRRQAEGQDVAAILEELEALAAGEGPDMDEMALETGRTDVVRVMNVHKAKGLQARVVLLADPLKRPRPRVEGHVERVGEEEPRGHFPVRILNRWGQPSRTLAVPRGWSDLEALEARHEAAEEDRLLYVAATRARDLLVVSHYPHSDVGPWTRLSPALRDVPPLEEPGEERTPEPDRDGARGRGGTAAPPDVPDREELEGAWRSTRRPSYRAVTVVEGVEETASGERGSRSARREEGRELGAAVHRLLELAARGELTDPDGAADRIAREEDLDRDRSDALLAALAAVRGSWIWRERESADTVLVEVPFGRWEPAGPPPRGSDADAPRSPAGTLTRGVVDLAYRSDGGWTLVDYKTHPAAGSDELERIARRYLPQIDAYRRHWRELTGEPVRRAGLFFTAEAAWWEAPPE